VKSKNTIIILIAIILVIIVISQQKTPQSIEPEINQTDTDDSIIIAITYEKLAENVITWPHPVSEENVISLVKYTEKEINQYCIENHIETRFRFIPTPVVHKGGTPPGENPPGLDEMIQLNQSGINLIVGHDYSLANRYSLEYANTHNMLLLSPFGVGISQSIADDNLYKLTPNYYENPEVYDKVFARMIKELGYTAFITINTGMMRLQQNVIIETTEALNYSYRSTLVEFDINTDDYGPYLERAEKYLNETIQTYGVENVCVLVEPLWDEDLAFLSVAEKYPVLSNVTWFDYIGLSEELANETGSANSLAKYGYVRLVISPSFSEYSTGFWKMYEEKVGSVPTPSRMYLEAARYDAMWIMALSVIDVNSSRTDDVKDVLPEVCAEYVGVIGNCTLNSYGDRISADYDVYKWDKVENETEFVNIGHYDSENSRFRMFAKPIMEWNRTFGGLLEDVGLHVLKTNTGDYIIAGLTKSFGEGEHDIYLLKVDSHGNKVWEKTFGGSGVDIAYSIQQCPDNCYVITGSTDFDGLGETAFLMKIDSDGDTRWMKTYGNNNTYSRFVQLTRDNGFILVGSQRMSDYEDLDFLLIRTDQNGKLIWNQTFDGKGRDLGRCVQQTSDGDFIMTGIVDSDGNQKGMFLIKIDESGSKLWSQNLTEYGEAGYYVQECSDGGLIITGYTSTDDVCLIKTDSDGFVQWSKHFGGSGYDKGSCVQETDDGDFIVVGTSSSFGAGDNDVYLFEVDASGVMLWSITFGGFANDGGSFVQETIASGFILTGYSQSFGKGDSDILIIKYSSPRRFR
jgi:ABC-type branched-subunit amino acid transport system substrate-binding protein